MKFAEKTKKKIFIATQYMELGGVERSLIGLLDAIDYSQYDVDVFIHRHSGELMSHINPKANLLPELPEYANLTQPIKQVFKNKFFRIVLGRLTAKYRHKQWLKKNPTPLDDYSVFHFIGNDVSIYLPDMSSKHYDLAISFLNPHNYVLDHVYADKKIAWIHTDYSSVHINVELETKIWSQYDKIIAISEETKTGFLGKFPTLEAKIEVIENILSQEYVLNLSREEFVQKKEHCITFCTVARFCYPKGIDLAVEICSELVKLGLNVKWYIIGYGDDTLIRSLIHRYHLEDRFVLLGKKSNPYPYIKACDLYVQPSRYEGKSVSIREALMLGKLVAITNFPTAIGHVDHLIDGVIVSLDPKQAAQELFSFIQEKCHYAILNEVNNRDYSNTSQIKKLYSIIHN